MRASALTYAMSFSARLRNLLLRLKQLATSFSRLLETEEKPTSFITVRPGVPRTVAGGKMMVREMKIIGFALDQKNQSSVIVLKDVAGDTTLPIVVGLLESTAIAAGLENIAYPRPMTHDLLKTLMDHFGVAVNWVEISDLREEIFYARIHLTFNNDRETSLDARPSDALAIALRTESKIYVHERVIQKSPTIEIKETGRDQEKNWRTILNNFSQEDFREY
jgi:hypothetical protein